MGKRKIIKKNNDRASNLDEMEQDKSENYGLESAEKIEPPKTMTNIEEHLSIFSDSLKTKLSNMQNFYKAYFAERAEEGENTEEKIKQVNDQLSSKLEESFSTILKQELRVAQDWIKNRQCEIDEETKKLDIAIDNIKSNLTQIKCFSLVEIEQNMTMIGEKKMQKRKTWEKYNNLLKESERTYQEGKIQEQ